MEITERDPLGDQKEIMQNPEPWLQFGIRLAIDRGELLLRPPGIDTRGKPGALKYTGGPNTAAAPIDPAE